MPRFSFDDRTAAWKSVDGKKWSRPMPQNMAGTIVRMFHDREDGGVENKDFDLDGRVIGPDGPMPNSMDNIMGGWIDFSHRQKAVTEAVADEPELEGTVDLGKYPYIEEALQRTLSELATPVPEDSQLVGRGSELNRVAYAPERYVAMVEATFEELRKLAKLKGGEYSGDDDRLANFRRNGLDLELPMEVIWRIYAAKHWDALGQYIRDLHTGKSRQRLESISGRVDDLLVYLLLFKAMIEERENNA